MKRNGLIITILFLIYLAAIFFAFYHSDKSMLAVFSAVGAAVYIIFIKRFSLDDSGSGK